MPSTASAKPYRRRRPRRRMTAEERAAMQRAALERCRATNSAANAARVLAACAERGIPADEVLPGENVLTFNAWRALGRTVRRGERGIRLPVVITPDDADAPADAPAGTVKAGERRILGTAHVFHVSQTDPLP